MKKVIRAVWSEAGFVVLSFCLSFSLQTAMAQPPPQAFQCVANAGVPPIVRAEDLAALTGDLVLNCTGGIPTPVGVTVPTANVQVFVNTNLTSRILYSTGSWAEPLLLIDEPSPANQLPCSDPAGNCPRIGGSAGPNVFMGQISGANSIAFLGVPIDPPGVAGTRIFRVTNLRVNANALGLSGGGVPTQVIALVSASGATSVPIANPTQTVGWVQQGLTFSGRTSDNTGAIPPAVEIPNCPANRTRIAALRFTEGFASAFRTRTAAAFVNTETSPAPIAQDTPGWIFNSETGFYNPQYPSGNNNTAKNLNLAGLADSGTRLRAFFTNIPAGMTLYVSTLPVTFSGGIPSPAPLTAGQARLVDPNLPFTPVTPTDTIEGIPAVAFQGAGGTAAVVWEVLKSDPLAAESLHFPIWVSFTSVTAGTVNVAGSLAPLSSVSVASETAPLPREADSGSVGALFSVVGSSCTVQSYAVATSPAGLSIVVDGTPYTAPQTFSWAPGSAHTIGVGSPQGAGGTRRVFSNWSDGGAATHSILAAASAATYTASFTTQHLLTKSASPPAAGSVGASPSSADGFYNAGQVVQLTASANAGYQFLAWSGDAAGTISPTNVTLSAPRSVAANFVPLTTITTSPAGLRLVIDGSAYVTPAVFPWIPGSVHLLSAPVRQDSGSSRYDYVSWSDGAVATHSISVPGVPTTFTASYSSSPLPAVRIGFFRAGMWLLDNNGTGGWDGPSIDRLNWLGQAGDTPLLGDWNGDGKEEIGLFRAGMWLLDYNGNGVWDGPFVDRLQWLGQAGDTPVVGDWDGNGKDEIGLFRAGMWLLDYNGNGSWDGPFIDRLYWLGQAGDAPLAGDWNGDLKDEIGLFRAGMWLLDYNGNGAWDGPSIDRLYWLGQAGDKPLVGDWNGDQKAEIGFFRNGMWLLDYSGNGAWDGPATDRLYWLGQAGDTVLVADWNGDGKTEIGFFRNGMWLLDYSGNGAWDGPSTDRLYWLGQTGDTPLTGRW